MTIAAIVPFMTVVVFLVLVGITLLFFVLTDAGWSVDVGPRTCATAI